MNDDTLTLYFYNDGLTETERRDVERALADDPEVKSRYARISRELNTLGGLQSEPAPDHMKRRWHDSIERAAQMERQKSDPPRSTFSFYSFLFGAAITATLAVGVGIGVFFSDDDAISTDLPIVVDNGIPPMTNPQVAMSDSFTRGIKVHLRDSRRSISNIPLDADVERTLLVARIIEQNRLYVVAAEQNDSDDLARVLRAFEPILVQLASDDLAPEDAEALRAKLAFQLNAMLTKLAAQPSKESTST